MHEDLSAQNHDYVADQARVIANGFNERVGSMRNRNVFNGRLDRCVKGIVLHSEDGHDFALRTVPGIDDMIGDQVVVVGIINEDETINAFRVHRDMGIVKMAADLPERTVGFSPLQRVIVRTV